MSDKIHILKPKPEIDPEREEAVQELHRLLACYQLATFDDRKVVWAVLNKYASQIII